MTAIREKLTSLISQRGKRDSHPGLLLQRYLHKSATGDDGNPEQKRLILDAAINAASNPEVQGLYKIAFERWQASLSELTATNELQTVGRLIVGLGTENVLETGIRLHHTYGLPVLPGSALKGLAAHYCDQVWGASEQRFKKPTKTEDEAYRKWLSGQGEEPNDNFHRLLFGTTDDSGCVVFHDAWFVPDSDKMPLKLDVMTPHHPKWLDGSVAPSDFDSPTPVPFLSVCGTFQIALSWGGPNSDRDTSHWWLLRALECLRDALFQWGIGGKTTSGYGRFDEKAHTRRETVKEEREKQRKESEKRETELPQMSPLHREVKEFLGQSTDKSSPEYSRLCNELKRMDGRWQDEHERKKVAQIAKEKMMQAKKWEKKEKDADRTTLLKKILGET